jgi:polar amino acid transport system substrate-binding protein
VLHRKNSNARFLSAAACLGLLATAFSGLLCAETVSIRADEFAPINNDPKAKDRGIMIELAERILGDAGHKVDYRLMVWGEAIASAKAGKTDCVVGALRTDVPSGFLLPKQPWVVSIQTVYARSDKDYSVKSIADLDNYLTGVASDYSYGDELDAYRDANIKNPKKIYLTRSSRPARDLLLQLITGQIQLVLDSAVVMDNNIRTGNLTAKIKAVGTPTGKTEELYIACSAAKASSQSYIALFDAGLTKLKASGEYGALLAKYGVRDIQAER